MIAAAAAVAAAVGADTARPNNLAERQSLHFDSTGQLELHHAKGGSKETMQQENNSRLSPSKNTAQVSLSAISQLAELDLEIAHHSLEQLKPSAFFSPTASR